jgi:undecaprenyl-diphosphatase
MDWIEAVILGLIQGLTEFLPVSSSGHLELAKAFFGSHQLPAESALMTVVLHFATALSTIIVFRKEVSTIIRGLFKFRNNEEFRFSIYIIISMVPAVIVGLKYDDFIESLFSGQVLLVGLMLFVTAALLIAADKAKKTKKSVNLISAFIIGIAQMVAIMPGISRSGATISTSVLLGIDRTKAARFSFLMVVPLILGKMAKEFIDGNVVFSSAETIPVAAGFGAAFVTGLIACTWMIALVKKAKLKYFALYCFLVGLIAVLFSL